jgi:hypothetical protein
VTTIREVDVRCAVCGALSRKAQLSSTSSFGPPDLDLRPLGPARWALQFGVQRCDECGYCAESLGEATVGARETVDSVIYRDVLERSGLPRLARSLFCSALIHEAAGDPERSAWRFLEAAWACDDRDRHAQARLCRERAVEMFQRALTDGEAEAPDGVILTVISDLLRRAQHFHEAVEVASNAEDLVGGDPEEGELAGAVTVAKFIRALAEAGDDESHNAAEAFAAEG